MPRTASPQQLRIPGNIRALQRIIAGPERQCRGLAAAVTLHNHFYTGRLSADDLIANMTLGQDFVNELLLLAR